ncbi:MAG: ATP synthase F1 subunit delta [Chitinophagales bacterium]|nr:ATP synthase F1 subunit delta [Chitinophagales bacterium]
MAIEKNSIPYAKALFSLATEKKNTASIKADVMALQSLATENAEFKDIIKNPTISATLMNDLVQKLFSGKLQPETLDFLRLLIKKGRIGQLASICEAVVFFINQSENLTHVKLTTATAVSDNEKSQIASKFLGDRKCEIENIVNPEIVGGFVLEFDNKILDNSISTQLQTLKNNLIN